MAPKLVPAWDKRTGAKRMVPEHWFDHDDMSAGLTRTDPKIPNVAPEGRDQAPGPDARDYEPGDQAKPSGKPTPKNSNTGDNTNTPPAGDN